MRVFLHPKSSWARWWWWWRRMSSVIETVGGTGLGEQGGKNILVSSWNFPSFSVYTTWCILQDTSCYVCMNPIGLRNEGWRRRSSAEFLLISSLYRVVSFPNTSTHPSRTHAWSTHTSSPTLEPPVSSPLRVLAHRPPWSRCSDLKEETLEVHRTPCQHRHRETVWEVEKGWIYG